MTRHATDRVDGQIIAECPNKDCPDDDQLAVEVEYHDAVDNDLLETFQEAFPTCGKCGADLDFVGQERPHEILTDGGTDEAVLSREERIEQFGEEYVARTEWWTEQLDLVEDVQEDLLAVVESHEDTQVVTRGVSTSENGVHELRLTVRVAGEPFEWDGESDE